MTEKFGRAARRQVRRVANVPVRRPPAPAPATIDLGDFTLPYWDPQTRAYGIARVALGTVHVKAGTSAPAPGGHGEQSAPRAPRRATTREPATRRAAALDDTPAFWLGLGAMPLAYGLVVAATRRGAAHATRSEPRASASPKTAMQRTRERSGGRRIARRTQQAMDAATARAIEAAVDRRRASSTCAGSRRATSAARSRRGGGGGDGARGRGHPAARARRRGSPRPTRERERGAKRAPVGPRAPSRSIAWRGAREGARGAWRQARSRLASRGRCACAGTRARRRRARRTTSRALRRRAAGARRVAARRRHRRLRGDGRPRRGRRRRELRSRPRVRRARPRARHAHGWRLRARRARLRGGALPSRTTRRSRAKRRRRSDDPRGGRAAAARSRASPSRSIPAFSLGRAVVALAPEDAWACSQPSASLAPRAVPLRPLAVASARRVAHRRRPSPLACRGPAPRRCGALLALAARDERLHLREGVIVDDSARLSDDRHITPPGAAAAPGRRPRDDRGDADRLDARPLRGADGAGSRRPPFAPSRDRIEGTPPRRCPSRATIHGRAAPDVPAPDLFRLWKVSARDRHELHAHFGRARLACRRARRTSKARVRRPLALRRLLEEVQGVALGQLAFAELAAALTLNRASVPLNGERRGG